MFFVLSSIKSIDQFHLEVKSTEPKISSAWKCILIKPSISNLSDLYNSIAFSNTLYARLALIPLVLIPKAEMIAIVIAKTKDKI
ncbi:hypothetical protein AHMF7605_21485 [Adhaeribacter arboris]|uniref:Uncharacterized protein n=1 Tax=Adhaeribacter arboris TaxID=2072846 RepID=A0A2T2YK73_9BACT|nr:hypothetical protein AHMF7605_21485 [Adhaeribacter arboris]